MNTPNNSCVIYTPRDFFAICAFCPEIIDTASFPDNIKPIKAVYTSGEMAKIALRAAGMPCNHRGHMFANPFTGSTSHYLQKLQNPGVLLAWKTNRQSGKPMKLWPADCFVQLLNNTKYTALVKRKVQEYWSD